MPPQSRGSSLPSGFQSKSTPNLSTVNSLGIRDAEESPSPERHPRPFSPSERTTPSEPASLEDSIEDANLNGDFPLSESESDFSDEDMLPAQSTNEGPGHRRLYSGQSSRSHTHLPPSSTTLFPPFYNRPPTPLPPSPSLTSLLRPSFSTQTSHPTTPETSDTESHTGPLATHTNGSSTTAPSVLRKWTDPVARATPKIPTYEYYGFALYLASSAAFLTYLLWAYLPSPFLHQLGIYYYLNRWWALAVPAWLVMGVVWLYVALGSYNAGYLTVRMESVEGMVDECAQVAALDAEGRIGKRRAGHKVLGNVGAQGEKGGGEGRGKRKRKGHRRHYSRDSRKERDYGLLGKEVDWRALWSEGTDAVMDVPIGGVCEILYGARRDETGEG